MLTNIKKRIRSIDAHCAQPSMLHFVVQELRSMVAVEAKLGSCRAQACKQESREPDFRWGAEAEQQPSIDFPALGSQQPQSPSEDQQPMCAATAMLHGIPMGASSSWQGNCPPIHELRGHSSCTARCHSSKSRIQGRSQHLAPRYQAKRPSSRTYRVILASLQYYGEPSHSKLPPRWSSASRRHPRSQP